MWFFEYLKPSSKAASTSGIRTDVPVPVYLEFIPGLVMDVVVNNNSLSYTEPRDINSIIAKPHIEGKFNFRMFERQRYFPLLRGITDVPVAGDQVLLCDFGGVNYYLGPVNTINNPNFNLDHLNKIDPSLKTSIQTEDVFDEDGKVITRASNLKKVSDRDRIGLSKSFELVPMSRIQKSYKINLDDPDNKRGGVKETHGDTLIEGRHGNSVRIGSRSLNPYVVISNNRLPINTNESVVDGSLISITSNGSILDHFTDTGYQTVPFVLASDNVDNAVNFIGAGNEAESEMKFDYDYGISKNQIFMNSDRITFNAKDNNITFSAKNNIDVGAGKNFTLNVNNLISLDANKIYLGKAQEETEPVVLGNELVTILGQMIDAIGMLTAISPFTGAPTGPLNAAPTWATGLGKTKTDLNNILSSVVFTEK